jgi:hypothetical protein
MQNLWSRPCKHAWKYSASDSRTCGGSLCSTTPSVGESKCSSDAGGGHVFVDGKAFLVTVSWEIKFVTAEHVPTRTATSLSKH